MTVAERVKQYEDDLLKLREQQQQVEAVIRRTEGAILALRALMEEEQNEEAVDGESGS